MSRIPACAALVLGATCVAAATGRAQTKAPAVKRSTLLKLAEPWPSPEAMAARRADAEGRRLFAGTEAFPFTLAADFKAINRDRRPEGKTAFIGALTLPEDGGTRTLHVTLRTRGHFRLRASSCSFVPLRVEFQKAEVQGTIFDGQKSLKLVTHCQSDSTYEQYVLREYLVYRALNLLTPRSFRARLARVTYVGTSDGKPIATRFGMFLEDDGDVARRLNGRTIDLPRVPFADLEQDTLTLAMVFEYMIGNTDYSIFALHNIRLIQTQPNTMLVVPYDFDLSGLVNTRYGGPDPRLRLSSVRERLYRGPCRSASQIEPVLDRFRAQKDAILALYDSTPGLAADYARETRDYLNEFFRSIDRPGDVKRTFIDGQCSKQPMM